MKSTTIVSCLVGLMITTMSPAAEPAGGGDSLCPAPTGLVAWWPAEDHADDIYYSGFDGTLVGGPGPMFAVGQVGQAFSFDGSGDYVDVDSPVLNEPPYTIEVWVRSAAHATTNEYIVSNGGQSGGSYGLAILRKPCLPADGCHSPLESRWVMSLRDPVTQKSALITHGSTTVGWTHLAVTWDGLSETNSVRFWLQGQLLYSGTAADDVVVADPQNLRIGASSSFGGGPAGFAFNGLIDEVTIYDRVLTPEEIRAIYDAGSAGKCVEPVRNLTQPGQPRYFSISDAIAAAADRDVLEAQPARYLEAVDFGGKPITLRSTDPQDSAVVAATIIDTPILANPGNHTAVKCVGGEGPDTILNGFTITGGDAADGGGMYCVGSSPTVTNCTFSGNTANRGGGMFCADGGPAVTNCTFNANNANYGSGIYSSLGSPTVTGCTFTGGDSDYGGGMYNSLSDATVIDCQFSGNSAFFSGGGMYNFAGSNPTLTDCTFSGNTANRGGGMFNSSSSPTVNNCTFDANNANYGSGIYSSRGSPTVTGCTFTGGDSDYGGGMYNSLSDATVIDCQFSGNSAFSGGGMYNGGSSPTVTDCRFDGNTADLGAGIRNAGGSSPAVTNCTFSGHAASFGGGMYTSVGSPTITNCTFSGNTAVSGGAIYNSTSQSNVTVTNSVLWGDSPPEIFVEAGTTTVTYSNVDGGWPGPGGNNIETDPLFVDAGGGNLRLSPGSPGIDAADNTAPGLVGVTTDLDANPRFIDDPATQDTGNGTAPVVDMGAYEFQGTSCPWDCESTPNGNIGINDFLELLAQWGGPGSCDFDSGGVGINDFLALLANWGPCS